MPKTERGQWLRTPEQQLYPAVETMLAELKLLPLDAATARLALTYAEALDNGACQDCGSKESTLAVLGPKLMAALIELGATPRARAAMAKGVAPGEPAPSAPAKSALEQQRDDLAAARARRDGTA